MTSAQEASGERGQTSLRTSDAEQPQIAAPQRGLTPSARPELRWIAADLEQREKEHLLRARREVTPLGGGRCRIADRILIDFAGNDYLDLAGDPRVIAAARGAMEQCGVGSRASALVSGRTPWHAALERRLAEFERQPAAILFPSGYAANVGTITALAGEKDVVFCDRFNHASLVDACRLCGARLRVYRHDRLERLQRELSRAANARRRFIITDAVFSMDGDVAPLVELCDVAERFEATIVVDEAHGTGVYGDSGRGACEELGVEERVGVRIGTLSKAVGVMGGFVAGAQTLIAYLWNAARTQMFST
ncbi:MAG: aminotransferase class I/II-fold pyridoxal phosphate-dependent enzyme, partial [Planctomycetes bacterium]|nr:aminotransferase class I/II-fold pyridoxal phosphate-dependent enzyme [Planctomycetota bacterium]